MKRKLQKNQGFSLLEVLITIAIFIVIILATVSTFASVVKARQSTRKIQTNLESIRNILEAWSKNSRMSWFVDIGGSNQSMRMYNNSQNACVAYRFLNGNLEMGQFSPTTPTPETECATMANYNGSWKLIVRNVTGEFKVTKTDYTVGSEVIGKATVRLKIGNENLQASSSFRDYQML